MRIHLIAIGGSIMHNLAIALKKNGHSVTGSDDEIYSPAKERLSDHDLLPDREGWDPGRIHEGIDLVILGMHARPDNPELLQAMELGVPIHSFPSFMYEHARDKTRVVIAGSHGKTTTTSMILYALQQAGKPMDYLVGARIEGFEDMVHLSDAALFIAEGDEYLSSPVDRRPKFIHYKPHVAVITGIAWDHMNVFPTFDGYKQLFADLIQSMEADGTVYYCADDPNLEALKDLRKDLEWIPYRAIPHIQTNEGTMLRDRNDQPYRTPLFGEHNMQNMKAALEVSLKLGLTEQQFLESMGSFRGASKRLQLLAQSKDSLCYLDFAHAPSKVRATVQAVRRQYPDRILICLLELHTFSSLNRAFLPQYTHTLDGADHAVVFYQEHTFAMKRLPMLKDEEVQEAFAFPGLKILKEPAGIPVFLDALPPGKKVFLFMTSGTFGGTNLSELAQKLVQ